MATALTTLVRPLIESRPPGLTWRALDTPVPSADQPTLDLTAGDLEDRTQPRPSSGGVQVSVVRSRWCARPSPRLPCARTWSVSLAQALVEALHALRPVAQLNRWLADDVLAEVFLQQRRRRAGAVRATSPPVLRSVRLQHPHPEVTEVSAHVNVEGRSLAMAFRLEASGERWLCTALELGPPAG